MISRRRFVQGAGVAGIVAMTIAAQRFAQLPPQRAYQVGVLRTGPDDIMVMPEPRPRSVFDVFLKTLANYGYTEGQNLAIQYRASGRGTERLRELVAELARLQVDVIVAIAGAALPAKQAVTTIPIVFYGGGDPVESGLVPSLARPDGNVTGITSETRGALIGKQLELLKEAAPVVSHVGLLNDANVIDPGMGTPAHTAAETLGLRLHPLNVHSPTDLAAAFEAAAQAHVDGLVYVDTPLLSPSAARIAELALQYRLPSVSQNRDAADQGTLISYGASFEALGRRAAYYVDRILRGTKPAELPVEQPREFDVVVNLKTAQALGLTIPQHVLLQATEIIQ